MFQVRCHCSSNDLQAKLVGPLGVLKQHVTGSVMCIVLEKTVCIPLVTQAAYDIPRAAPQAARPESARERALTFAQTVARPNSSQLLKRGGSSGSNKSRGTIPAVLIKDTFRQELAALELQHEKDSQIAATIVQELRLANA
jgi:hypothetical protein